MKPEYITENFWVKLRSTNKWHARNIDFDDSLWFDLVVQQFEGFKAAIQFKKKLRLQKIGIIQIQWSSFIFGHWYCRSQFMNTVWSVRKEESSRARFFFRTKNCQAFQHCWLCFFFDRMRNSGFIHQLMQQTYAGYHVCRFQTFDNNFEITLVGIK